MSMKAALEASEVLSERSKKFYDGTYKWDTYGFEDERGVYRPFGEGPDSAPPTPYPYQPPSDSEGDSSLLPLDMLPASMCNFSHDRASQLPPDGERPASAGHRLLSGSPEGFRSTPVQTKDRLQLSLSALSKAGFFLQSGSSSPESGTETLGNHPRTTTLRNDLFLDRDEASRNRVNGRLEGFVIGILSNELGLSLPEAYRQVGVQYPDDIVHAIAGFEDPDFIKQPEPNKGAIITEHDSTAAAKKGECYENASREPEKSPFSDISGMTDVSDPPSELIDPSDIRAITQGNMTSEPALDGSANTTPSSGEPQVHHQDGDSSPAPHDAGRSDTRPSGLSKGLSAGDDNSEGSDSDDSTRKDTGVSPEQIKKKKRKKVKEDEEEDEEQSGHAKSPASLADIADPDTPPGEPGAGAIKIMRSRLASIETDEKVTPTVTSPSNFSQSETNTALANVSDNGRNGNNAREGEDLVVSTQPSTPSKKPLKTYSKRNARVLQEHRNRLEEDSETGSGEEPDGKPKKSKVAKKATVTSKSSPKKTAGAAPKKRKSVSLHERKDGECEDVVEKEQQCEPKEQAKKSHKQRSRKEPRVGSRRSSRNK